MLHYPKGPDTWVCCHARPEIWPTAEAILCGGLGRNGSRGLPTPSRRCRQPSALRRNRATWIYRRWDVAARQEDYSCGGATKESWCRITTRQLIISPWLEVTRDSYVLPNGQAVPEYYIVKRGDSAICVCRIGDNVMLVRQYRPGIRKVTLCHPGGRIEEADGSTVQGVLREMLEETGL